MTPELVEVTDSAIYSWNVGLSTGHLVCELNGNMLPKELGAISDHMLLSVRSVKGFDERLFLIGLGYAYSSHIGVPSVDMHGYDTNRTPDLSEAIAKQNSDTLETARAKTTKDLNKNKVPWQVPA